MTATMAELIRRVERSRPPPPAPPFVPDPTVPARPSTYEELHRCKAALDLGIAATKLGWRVEATTSRGPYLGDGGSVLDRQVWALALRFYAPGFDLPDFVALWTKRKAWKFEVAWYNNGKQLKSTELRSRLTEERP